MTKDLALFCIVFAGCIVPAAMSAAAFVYALRQFIEDTFAEERCFPAVLYAMLCAALAYGTYWTLYL